MRGHNLIIGWQRNIYQGVPFHVIEAYRLTEDYIAPDQMQMAVLMGSMVMGPRYLRAQVQKKLILMKLVMLQLCLF